MGNVMESPVNSIERAPKPHEVRSEATRQRILQAAHNQFVQNGLEGTRMEAIAKEAGLNKSLVYRHFSDRENLYRRVLQRAYQHMRTAEAELSLPSDPLEALDKLISFTLNYYIENPDFLVLVGIENLKRGEHLKLIGSEQLLVPALVSTYKKIAETGVSEKLFRENLNPVELYTVVASQCWFTVATQYTFGITFDIDLHDKDFIKRREMLIRDNVRRWVLRQPSDIPSNELTAPTPSD
ncbi:TetR/AcrR family transcriptional regulator [Celeribacter halophilus]|nr:TetR/AcrR family transcriptional regulator [Celeribacter halophilus]